MWFKDIAFAGMTVCLLMTGCATKPIVLSPVGPEPAGHAMKSGKGYLEVFSATQKSPALASDDSLSFNLHSSYLIEDKSGQSSQFVPNHASNMDESPDQVALAPGAYNILAESTCCGQVCVSALIEAGKTTAVHLDRNWSPPSDTPASLLVFLPDGEVVGWSRALGKAAE